ncbi:hypothetical protein CYMTET_12124 [Cymbomonas tetramitiformis]|uniref:Uncharacterized protein n=1 Tax=Cymbomonas tetramitiformis TaxID=36881 RepID=A0AAE0GL82_9CHLO|nr:hypothetical protein CYMTET_12124 [Cymbomonas tetramitiformis]
MKHIKIFPAEGEDVHMTSETPCISDGPQPAELEMESQVEHNDGTTLPAAVPAMCDKSEDTGTMQILAKSLGVSIVAVNRWRIALHSLSPEERKKLQGRCMTDADAIWQVLAVSMSSSALQGRQGSLSKAVVAGVLCSLSAAGCNASAQIEISALWAFIDTLQQSQFNQSSLQQQQISNILAAALIGGIQTLDTQDGDTYKSAGKIVGDGLKKALTSEVGKVSRAEVLVAASIALHAWQVSSSTDKLVPLVEQARRHGQALLAAALTNDKWSSSSPAGESLAGGMQGRRNHAAKAIVCGRRYTVTARVPLEQGIDQAGSMVSLHGSWWWCGQCMRCQGLGTLMSESLRDGGGGAQLVRPVLVDVVKSVLLRRLAQVLGGDETARTLEGAVGVMAKKVIEIYYSGGRPKPRNAEMLRKVCTGDLDWPKVLGILLPEGKPVSGEILEAVSLIIIEVMMSQLKLEVEHMQEPDVLKTFCKVVAEEVLMKGVSGAQSKLAGTKQSSEVMMDDTARRAQQSGARSAEVSQQVLRQVCTGELDWMQLLGTFLPEEEVSDELLHAAAPFIAAVIVSKLQQELSVVQEPQVQKPFVKVVEDIVMKSATGAQQSGATRAEVMKVLRQACAGELDGKQLLGELLAMVDVNLEIMSAVAPVIAAVIVSKLQEVFLVQEPELLKLLADIVKSKLKVDEAMVAQQSECDLASHLASLMEVVRQACAGEPPQDWRKLLEKLLPSGEESQDISQRLASVVAAMIFSNLQEMLCMSMLEPKVLKQLATIVESWLKGTQVTEVLFEWCTGELDPNDTVKQLLQIGAGDSVETGAGDRGEIHEAVSHLAVVVIATKLQEVCGVSEPEALMPLAKAVVKAEESEKLLSKWCTGELDPKDAIKQLLQIGAGGSVETGAGDREEIRKAVSHLAVVVIATKLQEVCGVSEPEVLMPLAKAVVKAEEGEKLLSKWCTGELDPKDAIKQLLQIGAGDSVETGAGDREEIRKAVSHLAVVVIATKLQEVCGVSEPEALMPLAKAVVKAEEGEKLLSKWCTGELDLKDTVNQLLKTGGSDSSVETGAGDREEIRKAVSHLAVVVIATKLQEVCGVSEPEALMPLAKAAVKEMGEETAGREYGEMFAACFGDLDNKQVLETILRLIQRASPNLLAGAYHLIASEIVCWLQGQFDFGTEDVPQQFGELLAADEDCRRAVASLLCALLSGAEPISAVGGGGVVENEEGGGGDGKGEVNIPKPKPTGAPFCAREVIMILLLTSSQLRGMLRDGRAVRHLLGILIHSEKVAAEIREVYKNKKCSVEEVLKKAADLLEDDALTQFRDFIEGCLVARGVSNRTAAELVSEDALSSEALRSFVTLGINAPIFSVTLQSLEAKLADRLQDLEGTIGKLEREVNPSALVELAKEQLQANWGTQLLRQLYFYFMHRILPLVDLGTDALMAASLWEAGGQQRRVWFWITVTFMMLPYVVLAASVTIYWKSFWNLANPVISRRLKSNTEEYSRERNATKLDHPESRSFGGLLGFFNFQVNQSKRNLTLPESVALFFRATLHWWWELYGGRHPPDIIFDRYDRSFDRIVRGESPSNRFDRYRIDRPLCLIGLAPMIILTATLCVLVMSLRFIILIPILVVLDILLAVIVSPYQTLQGPFWASYEQLKRLVESFLESLPQAVVQLSLACTGNIPLDATLFLSLFSSLLQIFRHLSYLRGQGELNKTNTADVVRQLMLLEHPDHIPFSTVLQIRAEIDFQLVSTKLSSVHLKELSRALIGNSELQRLLFRCGQIDADGMRFLVRGLVRSKAMRELEFHEAHAEDDEDLDSSLSYSDRQELSLRERKEEGEAMKILLDKLPSLQALHTLRLDKLQCNMLDTFLQAAARHGKLRSISLREAMGNQCGETAADELKFMKEFVQRTSALKTLELCGFNLGSNSLKTLATHKGISSLKLARCKVDFAVCHAWSKCLSSVILLDIELADFKELKLLVKSPATCDIFVVIIGSRQDFQLESSTGQPSSTDPWAVRVANNLGKAGQPGQDDAKQPRLVLVGHMSIESAKCENTKAAHLFRQELERASLSVRRSLALLGSVLSALSDHRVLLSSHTDVLYANSRSLTTDAPSLVAIDVLEQYFDSAISWELVALSGWPRQISHLIAMAVCQQLKKNDDKSSRQGKVAKCKSSASASSGVKQGDLDGSIKLKQFFALPHKTCKPTLVLNGNTHDDSLQQLIASKVMMITEPSPISNLYLRSNAFTPAFVKNVAECLSHWSEDHTSLDLVDNDVEAASLFCLVKHAISKHRYKEGSTTFRLTEQCSLKVQKSLSADPFIDIELHGENGRPEDSDYNISYKNFDLDADGASAADSVLRALQSPEENVDIEDWCISWPEWFNIYVSKHLRSKSTVNVTATGKSNLLYCWLWAGHSQEVVLTRKGGDGATPELGDAMAKALAHTLKKKECKITLIKLERKKIGPEGAKALAVALTPNEEGVFNTSLNTLNLKSNQIGPEGAKALAAALTPNEKGVFNTSLNTLKLSGNEIRPEGAKALAAALTPNEKGVFNTSLNTLDVCNDDITGEAAQQLAEVVLKHPCMKQFNKIMMQDIRDDKVQELNLRHKLIGFPGALVLSKLLVFNTSLNTVDVSWNYIGPEGAKALAVVLTPNAEGVFNTSLNTLKLGDNKIGPEGAKALAAALTSNEEGVFNTSLNSLHLEDNNIGPDGAKTLAAALTPNAEGVFNTSLNTLNLHGNEIGPEGAKALAVALTPNAEGVFNTSLNTLDLYRNGIGLEGAKALAIALTPNEKGVFNTSLNTLVLQYNNLGDECKAAMQEAIRKHPNAATFKLLI